MRRSFVKIVLLLAVAALVVMDASAQRRRRTTRTDTTTTPTNQPTQQVQNNTQNPTYNPYGNVPIEMGAATTGGWNDTNRISRRNDNAVDKGLMRDRIPLAYEHLRWDDALYTERVWRELDL